MTYFTNLKELATRFAKANRVTIVLLILSSFTAPLSAQTHWKILLSDTLHGGKCDYTALSACDDHNFLAAGSLSDSGIYSWVVMRTTDGGNTWMFHVLPLPITPYIQLYPSGFPLEISQAVLIDSLRCVIVADSGRTLYSSDGGASWSRRDLPKARKAGDVSIANDGTGITVGGAEIALTSDWGKTWTESAFAPYIGLTSCKSYGHGRFRVSANGTGPQYTTTDSWASYDSIMFVDTSGGKNKDLGRDAITYIGTDSLLVVGRHGGNLNLTNGFIEESTNGGASWHTLLDRNIPEIPGPLYTVAAAQNLWITAGAGQAVLSSRDHGAHWIADTIDYGGKNLSGWFILNLTVLSDSKVIGISSQPGSSNIIGIDDPKLHVELHDQDVYGTHVYPNPASDFVTIQSVDRLTPVSITDVLGHSIASGMTDDAGIARFNVSHVASGVYQLSIFPSGFSIHITNLIVLPH
jgi:photosystem II stability/assembly factor-like uncharacterized protein